jgi:cell division septation protein DedD
MCAITLTTACVLMIFSQAYASVPSVNEPYPSMSEGQQAGSVSGRVTTFNTNEGLAGAGVAIVNASNTSICYATDVTNPTGNYTFAGVSPADGQLAYRIYALKDGYNEGYSNAFGVEPSETTYVPVIALAASTPTPSPTPTPYSVTTGTGHVSGRIKAADGQGAAGATVTVVNAGNFGLTYGSAVTNSDGYYAIDTTAVSTEPVFQLLVHKDGFQDAYSITFSLPSGGSAVMNINDNSIFPTQTPAATPTPVPSPTHVPTPSPVPTPTPTPSPVPTPTAAPTEDPATPTPHPSSSPTPAPVPGASPTARPTPGFEAFIALIGLAGVIGYKKLR